MPSHSHTMQAFPSAETVNPTSSRGLGNTPVYTAATNLVTMASDTLEYLGGGQALNNLQLYLGLSFIIALVGVLPSWS